MGYCQAGLGLSGTPSHVPRSLLADVNVNTLQAEALLGALGGLIGALVTTPADVVTTQILVSSEEIVPGPLATARRVYEQQGVAGFFKGATSRGLYWSPAIGIFLSLYCSLRQAASNIEFLQ